MRANLRFKGAREEVKEVKEEEEEWRGQRTPSGHILRTQHHLHRDERNLHTSPSTNPSQNLIPDPHPRTRVDLQRIQ